MKKSNHTNQPDRSEKNSHQQEQRTQLGNKNSNNGSYNKGANSNSQQTHDPKDGIQGERALNINAGQKDERLHNAKKNDSHDPKDGIQGESNVNRQRNKK